MIALALQVSDDVKSAILHQFKTTSEQYFQLEVYFDFEEKVSSDAFSRLAVAEYDGLHYRGRMRFKPSPCGKRMCCFYVDIHEIHAVG